MSKCASWCSLYQCIVTVILDRLPLLIDKPKSGTKFYNSSKPGVKAGWFCGGGGGGGVDLGADTDFLRTEISHKCRTHTTVQV